LYDGDKEIIILTMTVWFDS